MTEEQAKKKDRHRMFRALFSVNGDDWEAFKTAAGTGRAPQVLREFVAFYIGKPGAKLPRRPKTPE